MLVDPSCVSEPHRHVCILRRPDGREDIYRPGSMLFGSLQPIPEEVAKRFNGALPCPPLEGVFKWHKAGRVTLMPGATILHVWIDDTPTV